MMGKRMWLCRISLLLCMVRASSFAPFSPLGVIVERQVSRRTPPLHGTGDKNVVYNWLSVDDWQSKNGKNELFLFYNDEVMSHLHGYMLLVGTLVLQEKTFLVSFLAYAIVAAGATYGGYLPANPRVPACVAAATWFTTYGVLQEQPGGSLETAIVGVVCTANMAWGFAGPWNKK